MTLRCSLIAGATLCLAQPAAIAAALDEVLAADAAFAGRSIEVGQQAAFLEVLADESVLFRPDAVAGREWLATHESATGRLEWTPAAAAVNCSGQLAITTGRWQYVNAAGGEPVSGHYLSLWRRDAEGRWRVLLDHGIDHAAEAAPPEPLAGLLAPLWAGEAGGTCGERLHVSELESAEKAFNDSIRRRGLAEALRRAAARGALVYRDDSPPARLAGDGPALDARFGKGSVARHVGVIVQPGSDLAVSHGVLSADGIEGAAPVLEALYVRVWALDGKRWRVAIDLQTPLPADREH
jgi:ketosteroid isomerase-like protein